MIYSRTHQPLNYILNIIIYCLNKIPWCHSQIEQNKFFGFGSSTLLPFIYEANQNLSTSLSVYQLKSFIIISSSPISRSRSVNHIANLPSPHIITGYTSISHVWQSLNSDIINSSVYMAKIVFAFHFIIVSFANGNWGGEHSAFEFVRHFYKIFMLACSCGNK